MIAGKSCRRPPGGTSRALAASRSLSLARCTTGGTPDARSVGLTTWCAKAPVRFCDAADAAIATSRDLAETAVVVALRTKKNDISSAQWAVGVQGLVWEICIVLFKTMSRRIHCYCIVCVCHLHSLSGDSAWPRIIPWAVKDRGVVPGPSPTCLPCKTKQSTESCTLKF